MQGLTAKERIGRYDLELAVMVEMRWGWRDLNEAPNDLIAEIAERLAARGHWTREKERIDRAKGKTK